MRFRVMTPEGIVAATVDAPNLFAAADEAERRGYDVLDVAEPDAVVIPS